MSPHADFKYEASGRDHPTVNGNGNGHAHGTTNGHEPSASKPNILYIMADQLAAPALKIHNPESTVKTPNIDALAASGVVFDSAYSNSPLCAPARFCLVSGQLPHKIKAYDNASTLDSAVPTYAHFMRNAGYRTALAGKMHFIGPDQLHGYEERLTPDIYPGDLGWTVDYDMPDERQEWLHNASSILQAGVCARSNQLDYDEEVMYKSQQFLYDHVRKGPDARPFFLTVSLTHPHDPYCQTEEYWDQYEDVDIPLPKVNIKQQDQDNHSARLLKTTALWKTHIPEEAIRRARRAYYASITYVDDQIGKLLKTLKRCQLDKDTIIVFSGDHGDMIGERGLWYKMSFFEYSARVPLIFTYPEKFSPRRVKESVSTMDLLPTFVDIVGGKIDKRLPLDGRSLYSSLTSQGEPVDEVFGEYMGEGTVSPLYMIRRGRHKFITCLADPPQLFDLEADPDELVNLAASDKAEHIQLTIKFQHEADAKWDYQKIHDDVLVSQRSRRLCWEALKKGEFTSWDYEPKYNTSQKYIRSTIPLDDLELRARFPAVDAFGRDSTKSAFANNVGVAGSHNQ